jgi:superfamily II DNA or RNA helicase
MTWSPRNSQSNTPSSNPRSTVDSASVINAMKIMPPADSISNVPTAFNTVIYDHMSLRPHQVESLQAIDNAYISGCAEDMKNHAGTIILPTGSGKTRIQVGLIVGSLDDGRRWANSRGFRQPIYVIVTPRILLNLQHRKESFGLSVGISNFKQVMLHSERVIGDERNDAPKVLKLGMDYIKPEAGTSVQMLKDAYVQACRLEVPMFVYATYDSCERLIDAELPVYMAICDEAHHVPGLSKHSMPLAVYLSEKVYRRYFFTATARRTRSNEGRGMNNSKTFGRELYRKNPVDMILSGDIIRPRMHIVKSVEEKPAPEDVDGWVEVVKHAFFSHKEQLLGRIEPSIIVTCRNRQEMVQMNIACNKAMRPLGIRVMSICSPLPKSEDGGATVNGTKCSYQEFQQELQKDHDGGTIVLHVRVLNEGMDVPNMTGLFLMPGTADDSNIANFLQPLGRILRLHNNDRSRLRDELITTEKDDLCKYTKPYGWVIVPDFIFSHDHTEMVKGMLRAMRTFSRDLSQQITIDENVKSLPVLDLPSDFDVDMQLKDYLEKLDDEMENEDAASDFIMMNTPDPELIGSPSDTLDERFAKLLAIPFKSRHAENEKLRKT